MNSKVTNAVQRLNKILPLCERLQSASVENKNVYQLILKSYIDNGRSLTKKEISQHVSNIDETINFLRTNDMVVFDNNDEPIGAYPFTMEQRDHKVTTNNKTLYAMCALDALSISPMFEIETHIESKCHVTTNAIIIEQLNGKVLNHTANKDVHFGINWSSAANNCCATSLCTEMIFLYDDSVSTNWFNEDSENREVFTLEEAIQFASLFFKPLLN